MLILHHFCSVPSLKPHGLLICKMGRWAIAVWVVAMLIAAKFLQIANLIINGPLNQRHSIERLNLAIVHGIFEIPFNDCLISLVEVLLNVPLKHSAASIPFVKPTLVVCFFEHLLWSFGLHGSAIIVFPSFEPLWIMNMAENLSAGAQNIVTSPTRKRTCIVSIVTVILLVSIRIDTEGILKTQTHSHCEHRIISD